MTKGVAKSSCVGFSRMDVNPKHRVKVFYYEHWNKSTEYYHQYEVDIERMTITDMWSNQQKMMQYHGVKNNLIFNAERSRWEWSGSTDLSDVIEMRMGDRMEFIGF